MTNDDSSQFENEENQKSKTRKKVWKIMPQSSLMKKEDTLSADYQHHREIHFLSKKPRKTV